MLSEIGKNRLPAWLVAIRLPILLMAHALIFAVSWLAAYAIRFDFVIPALYWDRLWATLPWVILVQLACFWGFRTLHGWWRYVTLRDLVSFAKPQALSLAILFAASIVVFDRAVPRSVLLVHIVLSGLMLCLLRSSWRLGNEGLWFLQRSSRTRERAFIVSNHHDTLVLANQINSQPNSATRIVGILGFDKYSIGSDRAGIPILGTPADAPRLAKLHDVDQVLLVAGSIPGPELNELKAAYDQYDLAIRVIPSAMDRNPSGGFIPVRNIEINDLLQRAPVVLDTEQIASELTGQTILVTGAGGSIGSEICRQVLRFRPRRLILVDHRENSVFLIHRELNELENSGTELIPGVGDILDTDRMTALFAQYRPDFVYHAAAHKHVGLMEISPGEAVKNNILGTRQIVELSDDFAVKKFVLISTDKAVNPTSVMGCTKQIAERCALATGNQSRTKFIAVRFGNVLGSNGSVVPIFREQIARGGPITITDERMTRFFMTIPEASQLVLQAASMGNGGEIFVLDMGEPVRIVDLARKMVELAGLPESSIAIRFTGARPGEKMYEELYFDEEEMIATDHAKIFAAWHRILDAEEVAESVNQLAAVIHQPADEVRQLLKKFVPEYTITAGEIRDPQQELQAAQTPTP